VFHRYVVRGKSSIIFSSNYNDKYCIMYGVISELFTWFFVDSSNRVNSF